MHHGNDTVLVTGAGGFLAGHAILQLLEKGFRVRGTLRGLGRAGALKDMFARNGADADRIAFATADLSADAGWDAAAAGCRYVLHIASPFVIREPKDPAAFLRTAEDGARRVVEAAAKAGAARVVMTSSMAAVCYGAAQEDKTHFTAADWTDPDSAGNITTYIRSKTLAEKAAWAAAREGKISLSVVNPSVILGPLLDAEEIPSGVAITKMARGGMPLMPRMGWCTVDVRDAAALHILAMTSPAADGQRLLCSDRLLWLRDIAEILRQGMPDLAGKLPRRQLPDALVRLLAKFDGEVAAGIVDLNRYRELDCAPARALGWRPRDAAEAVLSCAQSMRQYGMI